MITRRIFITNPPKFKYKDNLHRIPKFVMRILLFLSYIFYTFHTTQNLINAIPYMTSVRANYLFACIVGHIILGLLNLAVFELVAKFYYGFITPIQPSPIPQNAFLEYLRLGYIVRNIIGGALKFVFFDSDLAVFGFDAMINLIVTTLVLTIICIYVVQKYVPFIQKSAFLKCVFVPYIVYQVLSIGVVLL